MAAAAIARDERVLGVLAAADSAADYTRPAKDRVKPREVAVAPEVAALWVSLAAVIVAAFLTAAFAHPAGPTRKKFLNFACGFLIIGIVVAIVGSVTGFSRGPASGPTISPTSSPPLASATSSVGRPVPTISKSKTNFIAAADALCADAFKKNSDIQNRIIQNKQAQDRVVVQAGASQPAGDGTELIYESAQLFRERAQLFRALESDWAQLERPVGDEGTIGQYLELFAESNNALFDAANELTNFNIPGSNELVSKSNALANQSNTLVRDYGHKICGH